MNIIFDIRVFIAKLLVALHLYHPVTVYYDCIGEMGYLVIELIKYPLGIGRLKTSNAQPHITEWCDGVGISVDCNSLRGYAKFKKGMILFGEKNTGSYGVHYWESRYYQKKNPYELSGTFSKKYFKKYAKEHLDETSNSSWQGIEGRLVVEIKKLKKGWSWN